MIKSVFPISFDLNSKGQFIKPEIEKVNKKLAGIYAIFNENIDGDGNINATWVFWGCGNIYDGLKKFYNDPCVLHYKPQYYDYITKYGPSEDMLAKIKSELVQLCNCT